MLELTKALQGLGIIKTINPSMRFVRFTCNKCGREEVISRFDMRSMCDKCTRKLRKRRRFAKGWASQARR